MYLEHDSSHNNGLSAASLQEIMLQDIYKENPHKSSKSQGMHISIYFVIMKNLHITNINNDKDNETKMKNKIKWKR